MSRIWSTPVTWSGSTNVEGAGALGAERVEPDGRRYRYVRNDHSATLAVGDVPNHKSTDTDRTAVVRMGTSGAVAVLTAGVVTSTNGIPASGFGWVQTRGYCGTVNVESTTDIAIGSPLQAATSSQLYATTVTFVAGNYIMALAARTSNDTGQIAGDVRC